MKNMRCLSCEQDVQLIAQNSYLVCPECDTKFPLIAGKTPVLLTEHKGYLASVFLTLDHFLTSEKRKFEELEKRAGTYPLSAERSLEIAKASASNNRLFEEMIELIEPYITKRDISKTVNENRTSAYVTGLDYLRRDWGWLEGGESEIASIKKSLAAILENLTDIDTAVIMGGGMGRVAYELADYFEQVTVVDYSLTMGFLMNKLQEEEIEVFEIFTKNLEQKKQAVKPLKASLSSPDGSVNFSGKYSNKVSHCVADATKIPFTDNSLSVYFSIYFTDVLPISQVLPEVKRALKNQGYFIHFGPLDYHFDDPAEKYSGDELIAFFVSSGFRLLSTDTIVTNHCYTETSLHTKTYRNLIYCFQLDKPAPAKLRKENVLSLNIAYTVTRQVTVEKEASTEIRFANGELYEGAELISLILQEIDGESTISELIDVFIKQSLLTQTDEYKLFNILESFVDDGIIKVVDR